ncbi:MAG: LysR family transcriptional regulator [Sulfuriferula sp.]
MDHLLVIDAIVTHGSFAAAAQALHRVPSALTYSVQKLEQDLAVQLFDRSGHRAALTAAGQALLQEGRYLLDAARELESRVQRIAAGVEVELRIAVSDLIDWPILYAGLAEFYAQNFGTRLRVSTEVYGGCWDALVNGRADLVLGAPNEGPAGGGYAAYPLGTVEFVFAVAPNHPLAGYPEPLQNIDIVKFRAVSAADSSRQLPARTSGLINGQDVLSLPSMTAKLLAQEQGLGVGYLPKSLAMAAQAKGSLVIKVVAEPKPVTQFFMAWNTNHHGLALASLVDYWKTHTILEGAAVVS